MPHPIPAVHCTDCGFAWNSPAMADGLRLLSSCPRCGTGALVFRDAGTVAAAPAADAVTDAGGGDERAPHLVLGVPRR